MNGTGADIENSGDLNLQETEEANNIDALQYLTDRSETEQKNPNNKYASSNLKKAADKNKDMEKDKEDEEEYSENSSFYDHED